jgi:hypothetical protein
METVMFSMTCLPLKDDFLAGMDSASASDEGASEAVNPAEDEDENLANGFLGRTVLDVMLLSGQPAREPVWVGQDRFGFLYKKAGPYDMPTNEWIWFVRGTSAYLGWGFPPPFGPDHAVRTYFSNRQDFIDSMGEPDESIGGPRADRYQSLWRDGDIEMAFTLNDVHGYPRFLIEFFDRDLLEEIDFDLRPDRETVAQVAMIQPRPEPRAAER